MSAPEPNPSSPKKTYSPPTLTTYGDVRILTQAGGSGPAEPSGVGVNMMTSDRSTKERAVQVGVHPLGIGLYLFDFRPEFRNEHGHGRQFGVMADEVERVMPAAVTVSASGHKQVNYGLLGVRSFTRH